MKQKEKQTPTLEYLREHRDEILALAEQHHAYNVRVFGSVARGEASIDSDVDLLVSFRDDASLFDLSGFWQDVQDLLGCSVDVTEDHDGLRERFRKRVIKDAVYL